ncbi:MAG: hypothetical protein IPL43_06495 [Micropruina sp.]|nr:hypothetical protein [Micropruina sp.]
MGKWVNGRVHQVTRRRPDDALVVEREFLHPVPTETPTTALGRSPDRRRGPDSVVRISAVLGAAEAAGRPRVVTVQGDEVVVRADARRLAVVPDWAQGRGWFPEVARHLTSTPGNPRINLSHYPDHPQNPTAPPPPRNPARVRCWNRCSYRSSRLRSCG